MFPALLNASCTINRNQGLGTNGRSAMQQLYTAVACLLMPMANRTAIEQKFSIGRAFDIYFNKAQDVRAGDQVIISGSTYVVKLIQAYNVPLVGYTLALAEQEVD